jgi:hypothetical protein
MAKEPTKGAKPSTRAVSAAAAAKRRADLDELYESVLAVTPLVADQVHTLRSATMVRMAFGESMPNGMVHFHTAIAMPHENARVLAEKILSLVEKAKAEAQPEGGGSFEFADD